MLILFSVAYVFMCFLHCGFGQADIKSRSKYFCQKVVQPHKSHFMGFDAPQDSEKWAYAQELACNGTLVLLQQVHKSIQSMKDIYSPDRQFRWTHHIADMFLVNGMDFSELNNHHEDTAPIVSFGKREFSQENFKGAMTAWKAFKVKNVGLFEGDIPKPFVGVGAMDENWGWLSTNFLNRTVSWELYLDSSNKDHDVRSLTRNFLDHPNMLMLLVNGHTNVSHPKVVSMPLGVTPGSASVLMGVGEKILTREESNQVWASGGRTGMLDTGAMDGDGEESEGGHGEIVEGVKHPQAKKMRLLLTAGSNYGARPAIRECVEANMGGELDSLRKKVTQAYFYAKIARSVSVLCMPGLGYDTYRLWETLIMGSMPVIERGVGLDRAAYKLPVLLVDDFADLTPELVMSAYVEALYRAYEWEYDRLTMSFWRDLLRTVSREKSPKYLFEKFPPNKTLLTDFVRPLFPFDCSKGCGPGTFRTPKRYCAIDTTRDWNTYRFGHFLRRS